MNARKRRLLIEQMMVQLGEVSLVDISEKFSVSEMTVRRDLDVLEENGVLRKIMGGAIFVGGKSTEPAFHARAAAAAEEKSHLATVAVSLIKPRQTVILDSGSTILAVAREIKGKGLGLTVVTPSVLVAVELAEEDDTTVLVTGGRLRPGELSLIGSEAEDAFLRYNCDVYFMGVAGVHPVRGASEYHRDEGAVKRRAAESADKIVAVIDQSKLGRVQLINVGGTSDLDAVVTDAPEGHPTVVQLREAGVAVYRTTVPGEKQ